MSLSVRDVFTPRVLDLLPFLPQMRSLAGDHNRPLHQNVVDVPPEISRAARMTIKEGSGVLKRVSTMARDAGAPEEV